MKTPRQTPPNVNDRNERLKAALQANIARRKAQMTARKADKGAVSEVVTQEAAQKE